MNKPYCKYIDVDSENLRFVKRVSAVSDVRPKSVLRKRGEGNDLPTMRDDQTTRQ